MFAIGPQDVLNLPKQLQGPVISISSCSPSNALFAVACSNHSIAVYNSRGKLCVNVTSTLNDDDDTNNNNDNNCSSIAHITWQPSMNYLAILWLHVTKFQLYKIHSSTSEDYEKIELSPCKVKNLEFLETNVTCVTSSRNWLVVGTKHGTLARMSWSGELIDEFSLLMITDDDMEITQTGSFVSAIACKLGGRLFGHVNSAGSSFLSVLPNAERPGTPNPQTGLFVPLAMARLHRANSTQISFSEGRPYVAVGLSTGDVEIHGVSVFTTEHNTIAIEHTHLRSLHYDQQQSVVSCLSWCPDSAGDCIAVGYKSSIFCVWSSSNGGQLATCSGNSPIVWGPQGYSIFAASPIIEGKSNTPRSTLFVQDFSKCCAGSLSPLRTSPWLRTCLQSTDSVHMLRGHDWDSNVLSWIRLQVPKVYLDRNWPIQTVAVSPNGNHLALAGIRGCVIYSMKSKRWRIFGSIQQEQSIVCAGLFWLNNRVLGVVHAGVPSRTYNLLCYPFDHLDQSSLLFQMKLPGRPVAADMDSTETVLVLQIQNQKHPYIYHVQFTESITGGDKISITSIESSIIPATTLSSAVETPRSLGTIYLMALPFGGSHRAGIPIKFPRCVTLDAIGRVHLIDTESGERIPVVGASKGTYQIWSHSWWQMQQDWFVVNSSTPLSTSSSSSSSSPRSSSSTSMVSSSDWPSVVRHAVWLVDREHGVRMWLPAIDEAAETLDKHGVVSLDPEVYPTGIHPGLGVLMAISTAPGASVPSKAVGAFHLRCSEIRTHIRPCLQGLLIWLIRAHRTDIARDVITLATRYRFPLLPEALESLLHEALEEAFAYDKESQRIERARHSLALGNKKNNTNMNHHQSRTKTSVKATKKKEILFNHDDSLVGHVVSLLKYCPFAVFASVVMNCARTVEVNRWKFLFPLAGRPEDLFQLCCDEARVELNRGVGEGEEPSSHVRALLHIAAGYLPLIEDEITTSRANILKDLCLEINDQELAMEISQYSARLFNASSHQQN